MKRSMVKPYEGNKPYIFVSYCHKDRWFVYPIIEYLARDGYRIWYDKGIIPGSSWNEVIADHVSRSSLCVSLISENAVASHNCKREINYAILENKPLVPVFIEKTVLSPGLKMQLLSVQHVLAYDYQDIDKCMSEIVSIPVFRPCLGEPDPYVELRSPYDYIEPGQEPNATKSGGVCCEWFGVMEQTTDRILLRKPTGETIPLGSGILNVGRKSGSANMNTTKGTDSTAGRYDIIGNLEISRKHFVVSRQGSDYYMLDSSKNGTLLNGDEIPKGKQIKLSKGDRIQASDEVFIFLENPTGDNTIYT